MILAERTKRIEAEAEAIKVRAEVSATEATIIHLKLMIEKLRRALYGQRSERTAQLIDQMELQLEELEVGASEDEIAAEAMARQAALPAPSFRRRPSRKPFPEHLPRERVVIPAPTSCPCCGSLKLSKLGEDITETLEVIPRSWKVIQTVREKFTCRQCETISQPPAPYHVTSRGFAGSNLLATILFEKFGQHQPLNRQSERYACEGIDLSVSTLADQVGAATAALEPLHALIVRHVLVAERFHADDTTVPILAKGKTDTERIWTYVRDDRPFGGNDPPAALYFASRDRRQEHPDEHLTGWRGILQADAYGGYNGLYDPARKPGSVTSALCWAHARRGFFELADIASSARRGSKAAPVSPIALDAVKRIDAIFAVERQITGLGAEERRDHRQEHSKPLVDDLKVWLGEQRGKLSRSSQVIKPVDYMLKCFDRFSAFLDDGRICLTNNAAERALRGFALGRKAWLFTGSDRGAARAAAMATLIQTAKLNDVDPQAWLADVLARIAAMPQSRLPRTPAVEVADAGDRRYDRSMSLTNADIDRIARIKIILNDIRPVIWRRVEVPLTASLKALHDVIQAVMLFESRHLFQFDVGEPGEERHYGIPDPDGDWIKITDTKSVKLGKLVDDGVKRITYTYDFGDDWRHTITIEAVHAADPTKEYPSFIDGARRAPPEDVGGWPGFEQFLEAMAKPRHPQRKDLVRWYGSVFNPDDIGLDQINKAIGKIARRRTIGKAVYAKSKGQSN